MDMDVIRRSAIVLLEHAPDAVYWIRPDGSIAYVNQAASAMLGYPLEHLRAMSIFEIDTELDPDFWQKHWQDTGQQGRVTLQRWHRHRGGELIPVEVRIRDLRVGAEHYHFSYVRDLRPQQQAEDLAERHALFFETVFMDAPLPQLIIDAQDMRIIDANRAARSFYGHGDALVGLSIPDINPLPTEQIQALIDRANREGRQLYCVPHRLASGEVRDMQVHTGRIRYDDQWFIHATNQDVTEINRARRHLEGFRDLIRRLPVGIFCTETGPEGRILEANPMLAEILEADSADDLIGRRACDFYPDPADRLEFSRRVERDGEVHGLEHELVTCKGRRIWVSLTAHGAEHTNASTVIEGAMENISVRKHAEHEREAVAAMFRSAIQSAPVPTILFRANGEIEQINDTWLESTGYTREQLTSIDEWTRLAYGDKAERTIEAIRSLARLERRTAEGDFRITCADGSVRIWSFHSIPLEPKESANRLMMSVAVDVTEERQRGHQAMLADAIIQSASEGVTITDADRNIVHVNPAFSRITGYREAEVVGRNPRILSSGRQGKSFYAEMWKTIDRDGHWQGEIWNRRKSGEIYPEWLSISAIHDSQGRLTNYAAIFTDLTELKHSQSSLARLRKFDPLTGLYNQDNFLDRLRQWLEIRDEVEQVAVMLLGLDRFRRINESYSHEFGDRVLRQVARRLERVRTSRILIGRAGSDRFIIAIASSDSDQAIRDVLRTVERKIAKPISFKEQPPMPISFSIGIARFPGDGDTAELLLNNAESAMFDAKRESPGTYRFFDAERTERSRHKLWLEHELRRAIDNQELEAHLQPIVAVDSNRVVGAEALARWDHPGHGSISPGEFIPVAEESGLVSAMSLMLLAQVAPKVAKIQGSGFLLAFNISAVQFRDPEFITQLLAALDCSGMNRAQFELELTESTMMEQIGDAAGLLGQLREHGIRLAIDDFGTGFSSLAYLQQIRANALKIDRRFINGLGRDPAGDRIVDSIIVMAHALGMQVVAEGVERQDQLDRLRQLGCDFYQGFLFSPAVAPDEFIQRFGPSAALA